MKRKSIVREAALSGIALHSGAYARIKFIPSTEKCGIVFIRTDLPGSPRVVASPDNVCDTTRGTSLCSNGVAVRVIEHVMAAIHAFGISDINIEICGAEPPATDGSSHEFFSALKEAGVRELNEEIRHLEIDRELLVKAGIGSIAAKPSDRFKVSFMIDFPGTPVGKQELSLEINESSFESEIAPARTFGFHKNVKMLRKKGLSLGASLKNVLVVGASGYINEPRMQHEEVRHKILDIVGDLGLIGRPIKAHIIAEKSNHGLNTKLAALLLKECKAS